MFRFRGHLASHADVRFSSGTPKNVCVGGLGSFCSSQVRVNMILKTERKFELSGHEDNFKAISLNM